MSTKNERTIEVIQPQYNADGSFRLPVPDDWAVYTYVYGQVRPDKSIVIQREPFADGHIDFKSFINRNKDWLRQRANRKAIRSRH